MDHFNLQVPLLVVKVALRFDMVDITCAPVFITNRCVLLITGFPNFSLMSGRVPSVKDETGAVSVDLHTSSHCMVACVTVLTVLLL